jgi:hypothetical protein
VGLELIDTLRLTNDNELHQSVKPLLGVDDYWVASLPKPFSQRLQKGEMGRGVRITPNTLQSKAVLGDDDYGWKCAR